MQLWFKNKFYDDLSDIRHESQGYYKHYVHNFFTHFFDTTKVRGKNILDFGCGPGFYSAILAQRGANVIGIDLSAFLIKKANEYKSKLTLSHIQFIKDDFLNLSLSMPIREDTSMREPWRHLKVLIGFSNRMESSS